MGIHTEAVQKLYVAYFNRPADAAGLAFWESVVAKANGNTSAVSAAFAGSNEYAATYANMSAYARVDAVYMNLFGRHAEPDGLKFWGQALISGASTIDAIVTTVAKAAQGEDKVVYANKVTAATAFSDALDTSDEMIHYSGDAANAAAKLFLSKITTDESLSAAIDPAALDAAVAAVVAEGTPPPVVVVKNLTKGIDNLTGGAGDDIFTAVDTEWSSLDKVNGGAGKNTFTVASSLAIAGAPAGATVANIDTMNVISGGAVTLNAATYGVNTLNVTAGGASAVTAAATTDVNELTSTAASSITGGKNVKVVHSGTGNTLVTGATGTVDITSSTVGQTVTVVAATGAVKVAAKGVIVADGATLDASIIGAVSRADQVAHSTVATNAGFAESDAIDASDAADAVLANVIQLKLDVTGAASFTAAAALTLTAYQNGNITRDQKIAIDAAFKAGFATNLATAQTGAAATVTPIVSAATAAATSAALAELSATAARGAADTVVSNDLTAGTGDVTVTSSKTLTAATITGNYSSNVSLADGSTLSNTLAKVTLDHAGAATLTGNALTNVTIMNTDKVTAIVNTTANHTQNLTLSAMTAGSGVTDNFATTVNIASNGAATNRVDTFSATQATAVNITGAAGFRASVANVAADAVITATNSSGANQIGGVGVTQSYLGGSGNDTVTVTGLTAQAALVSGGAGSADRLNVSNATNIAANATTGAVNFSGFEILGVSGAITVDVRDFTKSTFTSISTAGANIINGLNATQAGAITATASGALTLGIVGATTVGQLDTVKITASSAGGVNLGAISLAGVETLNLVASAAGGTTISSLMSATALTGVNVSGSGDVNITTGALPLNVNTVIDAGAVTGDVVINAAAALANGLRVVGSATGDNVITTNAFASVIVAGNGNNQLTAGAVADTITAGNGDNVVVAGDGNNIITLGNGFNTVSSLSGKDTIVVGNGNNSINSGTGQDKITLAAHTAGHVDYINVAVVGATAGANMDTITGFISTQDKLVLAAGVAGTALDGLALTSASSGATMLAGLTNTSSMANLADVYAALAIELVGGPGHEFLASGVGPGAIVARTVTFTTGAAAGTYLVINDDTPGFDGAVDVVIKLVGNTTIVGSDIITM